MSVESPIHAHIRKEARDCDGLYEKEYVEDDRFDNEEMFRCTVIGTYMPKRGDMTSPDGVEFGVDVTFTPDRFRWGAPTDEGYQAVAVQFCTKACDLDARSFRDHTAEAAGY